jgi:hypothetical protein
MGEKIDIHKTGPLTYSGYYDWPGLYSTIIGWAKKERLKVFETLYKDKISKGFTEREIEFTFLRKVDRMNKYIYKVAIKIWDAQKVEVTQNGEVKKIERGRLRVLIEGSIDRDHQGLFEKGVFWLTIRNIFYRMRHWQWLFEHADTVQTKVYELQKVIKEQLGMDTK